jgi:hypothetical protein
MPSKSCPNGEFGFKINHLATLVWNDVFKLVNPICLNFENKLWHLSGALKHVWTSFQASKSFKVVIVPDYFFSRKKNFLFAIQFLLNFAWQSQNEAN